MDIFFYSLLTNILYYCSGRLFISNYNSKFNSQFYIYFKGIIIISLAALLINFFTKLSLTINSVLYLIIIIFFLAKYKFKFSKDELFFLLISTLITFVLIIFSNVNRPDAGLYHLPYISMLNDSKIIIGSSNIHFRFGHTSIMQYLSAINNNYLFKDNGVIIPLASIVSFFYLYFFYDLWSVIKKKKEPSFGNIFSLFITIYISYKISRYSSFGNDAVPHLAFFYLISYILSNKIKNINIIQTLLISAFIFINKPTLIIVFFIPLIIFFIKESLFSKKSISIFFSLPSILLFFWFLKNLLVSGCLLYPVKLTCFEKLPWTNKTEIINVGTSSKAWSKGWPDRKDTDISMSNFNKNFNWIEAWSSKHLKYILKLIVPYIATLALITIFIRKYKYREDIEYRDLNIRIYLATATCSLGILFFFLVFPLYRYGYSYLISLIALIFILTLTNYKLKKNTKFLKIIFVTTILIFSSKQFKRVYENLGNEMWPNIYTFDEKKKINDYRKIKISEDFTYHMPVSGDYLCMYSKSPCTTYNIKANIQHEKIGGYSILKLDLKKE